MHVRAQARTAKMFQACLAPFSAEKYNTGAGRRSAAARYIKMLPFLFLSSDEDPIIPLRQGMRFCEKVRACGGRAEFYRILGAKHGADCRTADTMRLVKQFLKATL